MFSTCRVFPEHPRVRGRKLAHHSGRLFPVFHQKIYHVGKSDIVKMLTSTSRVTLWVNRGDLNSVSWSLIEQHHGAEDEQIKRKNKCWHLLSSRSVAPGEVPDHVVMKKPWHWTISGTGLLLSSSKHFPAPTTHEKVKGNFSRYNQQPNFSFPCLHGEMSPFQPTVLYDSTQQYISWISSSSQSPSALRLS